MEVESDKVLTCAGGHSNDVNEVADGPRFDPSDLAYLPGLSFWLTIFKAATARLTIRQAYWITCLGLPIVIAAVWITVLLTTHYGDNLPLFFKIGAPIFVEGVTAWFLLVKLKEAKNYREGPGA